MNEASVLLQHRFVVAIAAVLVDCGVGPDAGAVLVRREPPGAARSRSLKPYTGAPEDLRPFSKFTTPYYEYYQDLVEYNGAARDIPDPDSKTFDEIRIGFLAPLYDHPDQVFGNRMLQRRADWRSTRPMPPEATAANLSAWSSITTTTTGRTAAPPPQVLPRDSAIWGAASNDAVRMIYDDKVWAMFGSISSESTHIALRLTLKAETPLVNSASTDPTIPETNIPWYFTDHSG